MKTIENLHSQKVIYHLEFEQLTREIKKLTESIDLLTGWIEDGENIGVLIVPDYLSTGAVNLALHSDILIEAVKIQFSRLCRERDVKRDKIVSIEKEINERQKNTF